MTAIHLALPTGDDMTTTAERPQITTNALPFSPLTRRGLSELSEETTKDLGALARTANLTRDYFFEEWGDDLGSKSRLWSDVLEARQQRQTKREGAPHGDDMDGHHTDLGRSW